MYINYYDCLIKPFSFIMYSKSVLIYRLEDAKRMRVTVQTKELWDTGLTTMTTDLLRYVLH